MAAMSSRPQMLWMNFHQTSFNGVLFRSAAAKCRFPTIHSKICRDNWYYFFSNKIKIFFTTSGTISLWFSLESAPLLKIIGELLHDVSKPRILQALSRFKDTNPSKINVDRSFHPIWLSLIKASSNPVLSHYTTRRHWHCHDDVVKWKHFPRYWPFVRGIHRSPVNSSHKGQWRGALIFSLICVWINGWVNNREAGDLRRYRAHYDVSVMVTPPLSVVLHVARSNWCNVERSWWMTSVPFH